MKYGEYQKKFIDAWRDGKLASNGHRLLKCLKCGYENDRDVIACLNMLRMKGAPLPLKATDEALAEVERIVIKCQLSDNGDQSQTFRKV